MDYLVENSFFQVDANGFIYFTERGRAYYAPRFATCGYLLDRIQLYDEFQQVEQDVRAHELGVDRETHRGWRGGSLTPRERAYWAAVLRGEPETLKPDAAPPAENVIPLPSPPDKKGA